MRWRPGSTGTQGVCLGCSPFSAASPVGFTRSCCCACVGVGVVAGRLSSASAPACLPSACCDVGDNDVAGFLDTFADVIIYGGSIGRIGSVKSAVAEPFHLRPWPIPQG